MRFISSSVQANGQITLPSTWRRKYNLRKGDAVLIEETSEGLVVRPQMSKMLYALRNIGEGLKQHGITEQEMRRNGRKLRANLVEELYGLREDGEGLPR